MAFDEKLSDRIREALANMREVEEELMFGGVCYMVNDKMCVGVIKSEMMCRVGPEAFEEAIQKPGCHPMQMSSRPMVGYVLVSAEGMQSKKDFQYWINPCLAFNVHAKSSKKKTKNK